jgi:L-fuculose-phosphate aldolase
VHAVARQQIVEYGRLIHAAGLVAASDGNLSVRLPDRSILITPTGVSLGQLTADGLARLAPDGERLTDGPAPSSEFRLHLAAYAVRPDVAAVIHAHPPHANAFTFAGVPFPADAVPEVALTLGRIPVGRFAIPASAESAAVAAGLLGEHDAILLARHGSVTLGTTLDEAFAKLEKLEHTARTLLAAQLLGQVVPISDAERARLQAHAAELAAAAARSATPVK